MPLPDKNSKPRLAAGCRWAEANGSERMLMFPEGALRLQGTGREILERCDGQRSIQEIVDELQAQYKTGDSGRIEQEVSKFIESLQQKRIVDF
jgi:pyrroloquinoline quinone biosynthesis protein D